MKVSKSSISIYDEINSILSIRRFRLHLRLTQEQIANYLDIKRSTYTRYENADKALEFYYLNKLSKLYNVPLEAFYKGVAPENYYKNRSYIERVQKKLIDSEVNTIIKKLQNKIE